MRVFAAHNTEHFECVQGVRAVLLHVMRSDFSHIDADHYNYFSLHMFISPSTTLTMQDLTMLRNNMDLTDTIIVDNSPMAYMFQPDNAIDCTSWLEVRAYYCHYYC
jgi:TFIIF-interacting CTD phosphatase-like protein